MRKQIRVRAQPKVTGPAVRLFDSSANGKFCVTVDREVGTERYQIVYLHKDGRWRKGAMGKNKDYSGYYDTRQQARSALRQAKGTYWFYPSPTE